MIKIFVSILRGNTNDGEDVGCLVSDVIHLVGIVRALCVARDDIVGNTFQFFECEGNDTLQRILVAMCDTKRSGVPHSLR
jgi:hypothetical protein